MADSHKIRRAFTIVELMIVVFIIAIMAAIVVPRISGASSVASQSALAQDLHSLRVQIQVYTAQHGNVPPGYPNGDRQSTPDEVTFVGQMTNPTSALGEIGSSISDTYRFGPYLAEIPANPINGSRAVRVLSNVELMPLAPPTSETGFGWIYQPATRDFRAYIPGQDIEGVYYYDY